MARYRVTFTQNYDYEVEAENESEAESLAYNDFESDMRYPVANTSYDECEVECLDDEE